MQCYSNHEDIMLGMLKSINSPTFDSNQTDKNNESDCSVEEDMEKSNQTITIDVLLNMTTNVLNREEEQEKCICSYSTVTSETFTELEAVPNLKVPVNEEGEIDLSTVLEGLSYSGSDDTSV